MRKREPGRVHLDGFFSYPTKPYSVPYGVIVPKKIDGLLTPVPASGTHVGFSTLRMEPCWMALGQAAGAAAAIAIQDGVPPRRVDITKLQLALLDQQAMLVYYQDAKPGDAHYEALQFFAVRGIVGASTWEAKLAEAVSEENARQWITKTGLAKPASYRPGKTTRGELLGALFAAVRKLPPDRLKRLVPPEYSAFERKFAKGK